MKKKVFLYAYDKINLGDDLFVHTIVKRYPHVQFYLWSVKENISTFCELKNLKVIDQNSVFLKVLKKIRESLPMRYKAYLEDQCNAVVYIGGSIFIEYDNWSRILNWWDYEANTRPFYVLGANFGPYKNEDYRKRLDSIFLKMQDVCFRDDYSYKKFENNKKIRMAPDILFSCEIPQNIDEKKQVFISVIDFSKKEEGMNSLDKYSADYTEFMLKLINKYLDKKYKIVLSSFCKKEGDEIQIQNLMELIEQKLHDNIEIVNYNGTNSDLVLQKMAESEIVLASRFHAFILGLVAKKKVCPIIYSDKTLNVMKDIGFDGIYVDVRNLNGVNSEAVRMSLDNQLPYEVDKIKEMSYQHFIKLDKVLKE